MATNVKKIKKIEVVGFRGARYPLSLNLTSGCKSIAIFGENASGKSTITDALEWFFYDKVEHLWIEGCKKEALRNLNLNAGEHASVVIEIDEPSLSSSKDIDGDLGEVYSNNSEDFQKYLAACTKERLILRNKYMHSFIDQTKGEKKEEIAKIIGYDELLNFIDVIRRVKGTVEKEVSPISRRLQSIRGNLLGLLGSTPSSMVQYYEVVNTFIKPHDLNIAVENEESLKRCLSLLQEKASEDKLKKRLKMDDLLQKLKGLRDNYTSGCKKADEFFNRYCKLAEDRESILMLNVEEFLSKGLGLIVEGIVEEDKCPFCFSEIDMDLLKTDVKKRISRLSSIKTDFEEITGIKKDFMTDFGESLKYAREIILLKESVSPAFLKYIEAFVEKATGWLTSIEEAIKRFDIVTEGKRYEYKQWLDSNSMQAEINFAETACNKLGLTAKEEDLIKLLEKIRDSGSLFREAESLSVEKDIYEKQIRSLVKLQEEFNKVLNLALQNALNLMSEDTSKFYLFLHPHDNVDTLRLEIINNGAEFKYKFHGHDVHPPQKYLSESHLNSLAIALFLASVKLFNIQNKFFVLDDVVSSFDADHRTRLLRLLKECFADYQILLLTHEKFWFEIIKRELPRFGWLINEVSWDFESGVQLKRSPLSQRGLINQKRSKGLPIGNDIRILLEKILKELCMALEVRLPYRSNDTNEARTLGELWSGLRGTVKRKSPSLGADSTFTNLETTSFLANWTSHDNPPAISEGDEEVMLNDIDKLESLFICTNTNCEMYVNVENYNPSTGQIFCRCGKKFIEWKR